MRTRTRRKVDIVAVGVGALALGGASCAATFVPRLFEEIDSYWTSATVAADGSARVTEVIDYDFGVQQRHGVWRWVPGLEQYQDADITASSPDAPDQFAVTRRLDEAHGGGRVDGAEIRIGDPDRTISGRHRYEIGYDLPGVRRDATVKWEAVGTQWKVGMSDVEVHLVTPFVLDAARCFHGPVGSTATCEVREVEPGHVVATVDGLGKGEGVSIEGVQGAPLAAAPAAPSPPATLPPEEETADPLVPGGVAAGGLLAAAVPATVLVRRAGRERVYEGGAADAAFGGPPLGGPWMNDAGPPPAAPPGAPPPPPVPGAVVPAVATGEPPGGPVVTPPPEPATWTDADVPAGMHERRVSVTELEQMTTIEFAPPSGITPAHGGIVLRESVEDEHKVAWLIQAAIDGVVDLDDSGRKPRITHRDATRATPEQAAVFGRMFGSTTSLELGKYDKDFASAWGQLGASLSSWRRTSGLWDARADGRRHVAIVLGVVGLLFGIAAAVGGGIVAGFGGATALWLGLVVAGGCLAGAALAALVGAHELHVRTAAGSSLWLRIESFRRFLASSEAYHAEEAARRGVLREYTAWAVAVGEVRRWGRAVEKAAIAPEVSGVHYAYMAPALVSSTSSTATAPSSSGGGGGGSVGGGAGGGGGGSW